MNASPPNLDSEDNLFQRAIELPPEARVAFLDQACAGRAELRLRLDELLAAHQQTGNFLEPGGPHGTLRLPPAPDEAPGAVIGNYKLREMIGEGGFGVVYVADQEKPVRRRVALKLVKLGMDTRQVIARFEAERQALAMMDHPNIAKVLDAGATSGGRPYFVMELVRGIKITDYCDQNHLSTGERLKLFIQVCQAVQHAHQKGIIHRDIKPSNILVTLHDGLPVPKVIDFGIAKAANQQQLTDKTVYTALEQFMGTPAYMSPEQAEMSGLDIDTRSDIYSLGVLLYELLTGNPPFDPQTLFQAGIEKMRRMIREEEPPKPSTRLNTLAAIELTTVADRRRTEAPKLLKILRGDLDWIVMKCLEKDRVRRYESASGLASDVLRHLNNEQVAARPPTSYYRFQKLVRRHKTACAAVATITFVLALGFATSTWMYLKEQAVRKQAVAAEKRAEAESARFLEAVKVLHFGETNLLNSEYFYSNAFQLEQTILGNGSAEYGRSLIDLANTLQSEKKFADAETLLRSQLAKLRGERTAGAAPQNPNLGLVLHHLADLLRMQKKLSEANKLAREACDFYEHHPEAPAYESMHAEMVQADVLTELGDFPGLRKVCEQAAGRDQIWAMKRLAQIYSTAQGVPKDMAQAVAWYRRAAESGDDPSEFQLAYAYLQGQGVPTNTAAALEWFGKSADHQNGAAAHWLAKMYANGWGVSTNIDTAIKWYRVASQNDDADAADELAKIYRDGKIVPRDAREAIKWYRKALDGGYTPAAFHLGSMYERGDGLEKDPGESRALYAKGLELIRRSALEENAESLNSAAWALATCSNPAGRDPQSAVGFAEKAVLLTKRKDPNYLDTLAAAYAAAGDFRQASAVESEAISLTPDTESYKKKFNERRKQFSENKPYFEKD